jgi:putative hydroxymethylpyrimidine transport system substrate-binding protein
MATAAPHRARALAAAAAAFAVLLGAGCGKLAVVTTSPKPQPFTIALAGTPGPDEAAILVAETNGYVAATGLETKFLDTQQPVKALTEQHADMAIVSEPELLEARAHGAQALAVAALIQRPLSSVITIPTKGSEQHATGRVVGTDGSARSAAELETIDAAARAVDVGARLVGSLLTGRMHETLGATWNYQALEPALQRKNPMVEPVDRLGVPTYDGLLLAVRIHDARYRGQDIRALLLAFARGQRSVVASPDAAARIVSAAAPGAPPRLVRESINATLEGRPAGVPWGQMSEVDWHKFGQWMADHQLISSAPEIDGCTAARVCPFTNEYLPGEGI